MLRCLAKSPTWAAWQVQRADDGGSSVLLCNLLTCARLLGDASRSDRRHSETRTFPAVSVSRRGRSRRTIHICRFEHIFSVPRIFGWTSVSNVSIDLSHNH